MDSNEKHRWIIIDEKHNGRFIKDASTWKEALAEYMDLITLKFSGREIFLKALKGFDTPEEAVEFINIVFMNENIEYMFLVDDNAIIYEESIDKE